MVKRFARWLLRWDGRTTAQRYVLKYRILSTAANLMSLLPLRLPSLLRFFGSDKQMPGWHRYGDTYARIFSAFKYRRLKLLEIGIGGYAESLGGRSLLAWQAYFPFATIIAADIVPKHELGGWRRHIHTLDQSSQQMLDGFGQSNGPFDIIIDDGSHMNAHQVLTFHALFPHLRNDGLYVVEDVQTSFWSSNVAGFEWDGADVSDPAFSSTCVGHFLELAKYINHAEFPHLDGLDEAQLAMVRQIQSITFVHNLIIVRKGDNTLPSTFIAR